MRRVPQWHEISRSLRKREYDLLAQLPYFTLERTAIVANWKFVAIGTLHFTGHRSGREHHFPIKIEYPPNFPKEVPRVFDHDKHFAPSPDGHLFSTHELCLTLPERGEFSGESEKLTEELLGASLIWFHKRLIFDRTRHWPGPAERHGIKALIDLLVEREIVKDPNAISAWLVAHAATPDGRLREPDIYAQCPCGSDKALRFCHQDELSPIFRRLRHMPPDFGLTQLLDRKEEGN